MAQIAIRPTNETTSTVDFIQQGEHAFKAGDYEAALEYFRQALHATTLLQRDTSDNVVIATIYRHFGNTFFQLHQYDQARLHLKIALEKLDKKSLTMAHVLEELAIVTSSDHAGRDYHQAKRYLNEALDIKRLVYGRDATTVQQHRQKLDLKQQVYGYDQACNVDLAHTIHQMGNMAQKLQKYHKARNHYQEALRMYRHVTDNNTIVIAQILYSLGQVNQEMGRQQYAQDFYKQALDAMNDNVLDNNNNTTTTTTTEYDALMQRINQAMVV